MGGGVIGHGLKSFCLLFLEEDEFPSCLLNRGAWIYTRKWELGKHLIAMVICGL